MNTIIEKRFGFNCIITDGEVVGQVKKVSEEAVSFEKCWTVLSMYQVSSGCQLLGWIARCRYETGEIEWLARTRDGATSTRQLLTKAAAADLLVKAYDTFTAFDSTTLYDSDSKLEDEFFKNRVRKVA